LGAIGRAAEDLVGRAVPFSFYADDLGNTFICGPSGSRKTVLQNFLLAQAEKLGCQRVMFDKDRGAEIFVRASGGTYLTLKNGGVSTGCAPLKALEPTPSNLAFLSELVRKLVTIEGKPLSVVDEQRIDSGLEAMRGLPKQERSLSALRAFLGQQDREGIGARLESGCRGGPLGWVLDAETDAIVVDANFIGFDMTDVLDHPVVRTPLIMVLFHRVEQLIDGRRIIIDIDEFWKALGDDAFRALANDKLKTIRKQNGVLVFGTQSPRDALASPIAHTIVEQCPTQIFMPNPRATRSDYVDGFHLTQTEFQLIKEELSAESRRFLVKQNGQSVVAELDLKGMDEALAVLSGRTETVALLDRIREDAGDEAFECFEPPAEVVGRDEVDEVAFELRVIVVVVTLDGRVLDRAVHPLDLTVGPRVLRPGGPMVDVGFGAGEFEGVGAEQLSVRHRLSDQRHRRAASARRREVDAVVGQHGVDLVGDHFIQPPEEVASRPLLGFSMKLDERELAGPVDGDEHVESALGSTHFGEVDVEEADRVALELRLRGRLAFDLRQAADPVALQAAMQR